jgi:hypothetical protein
MTDTCCSICLNDFGAENLCYTLDECDHKFHISCIMPWFRQSSKCPNCRDNPVTDTQRIPAHMWQERAKELRKISKRKTAPKELKNIVDKIKNIEIKQTEHRAKTAEFKNANKEILQTQNKLRREYWKLSGKKHNHLKQLGIFQSPNYRLPSLIINHVNY